ncbi:MAG TPA: TRAP transporter substrate-binding protein DctP [Gammaproteobacteria bacterium]|jgi:TRAP-type C4-dicarboxylate transport system substrate-binding protein|nr:TRAP transporter substrate-binding protein DctP [Gammaproteobacteria bacterium]
MRSLCLAFALLLAACARPPDTGVTELVYATPYSPNHPFSRADQRWMKFVEERSGGTLKIRPSWSGALLSSEHSLIELRHGVVDIGLITPIYVKGGVHLIRMQSGFYSGATTIEGQVALYHCMAAADEEFDRELAGLKVLAVQGGTLPGLVTRDRAVASLAELRGMRIRVPTELLNVMRALGADPVNMPMGDVYSALAKGVIDGVIAPTDTFRSLHLTEVAHYYTRLAVPRGAYPARAMGLARWERLSPEHRAVLEASIAVWEQALADENRRALEEGWRFAQQQGVVETPISDADQQTFNRMYVEEAERNASELARYGIDGTRALRIAQASIRENGEIRCQERVP